MSDNQTETIGRDLAAASDDPPECKPRAMLKRAKVDEDGKLTLEGDKEERATLDAAFGSDIVEFETYCLTRLVNILGAADQTDFTIETNAALAMLTAIAPRDELEAALAVQMVASNHLALRTMSLTSSAANPNNRQTNGNLATKFSRTFIAQLEALDRHRRGGKQIVEHVHVNAGGQAVIAGSVTTGGGRNE